MVPSSSVGLHISLRFLEYIRFFPLYDGQVYHQQYAQTLKRWYKFEDKHVYSTSDNISDNNRGLVLLSKLYGLAKTRCDYIGEEVPSTVDSGVSQIIDVMFRRDTLPFVTVVYQELQSLLATLRAAYGTYRDYESLFDAQ